jgi:hypothetical protein
MVVPWENEVRACKIEEMLTLSTAPEPTDLIKREVIGSLIDFFPVRDPTPTWWSRYVRWYNTNLGERYMAWTRLVRDIERYREGLEIHLHDLQDLAQEGEDESDYDYEGDDRRGGLPAFFVDKFQRISHQIVVNEWMLHKRNTSPYSPALIIRVALYQMETSEETEGTFLDLLLQYVERTVQQGLNR